MDCKLCFKRFSNGKALGAHMRSHYAILPLPPKPHPDDTESSSSSSSGAGDESKSKSEKSSRFKRPRGINLEMEEEEDVALCLIMLSRDVWRRNSDSDCSSKKIHRCEECQKVFKSSQGLGSHKSSHSKRMRNSFQGREEGELAGDQVHECSLCPRIFKSAQALGGHKRSHFPAPKFVGNLVDLNLPAVNEEILA
ncbi:hypothetical protein SASPL_112002 [Salvia splendens]|uniref:C2H2-type domain-containing protein n=1 Tax=Salvia splendens TaxID=180675 RepID=A0A8X8Y7E0_SALSN|nr:zinc finger protein ZAT1-like [Salvia splendens]KAG6427755.1 hypothetical protein SASPL_112002 [Salvia splendens]